MVTLAQLNACATRSARDGQQCWVGSVNVAAKCDFDFFHCSNIALPQFNVEVCSVGHAIISQNLVGNLVQPNGLIYALCIQRTGRINDGAFEVYFPTTWRGLNSSATQSQCANNS
ncbi:hypothetical protein D3C81_1864980 [compost metagenome]